MTRHLGLPDTWGPPANRSMPRARQAWNPSSPCLPCMAGHRPRMAGHYPNYHRLCHRLTRRSQGLAQMRPRPILSLMGVPETPDPFEMLFVDLEAETGPVPDEMDVSADQGPPVDSIGSDLPAGSSARVGPSRPAETPEPVDQDDPEGRAEVRANQPNTGGPRVLKSQSGRRRLPPQR